MPYQHISFMARVVHLFAGSEGASIGLEVLFVKEGFFKKINGFRMISIKILRAISTNIIDF